MSNFLSQAPRYLTDFGKFSNKSLAGLGVSGGGSSWIVVLFLVFIVLLIGFTSGRTKMLLALLAIYGAVFIESLFPYFDLLKSLTKDVPSYWIHFGLFMILYLIVFFALNHSLLKGRVSTKELSILWIFVLAILEIGLITSIFSSYLGSQKGIIPSVLVPIFETKTAQFVWAVLPIIITFLLKGKEKTIV